MGAQRKHEREAQVHPEKFGVMTRPIEHCRNNHEASLAWFGIALAKTTGWFQMGQMQEG